MAGTFATVDEYVRSCPDDVQVILERIRATVHAVVPGAGEAIRYQLPTITLDGSSLVHFAAWKHHIGLYPLPTGDEDFEREIAPYRQAKGTARFPLDREIPYDLIARLAVLLVERRARSVG